MKPSAQTPGGHSRYSFEDLVALRTVVRLLDARVSLQRIRASIGRLRGLLPSVSRPLVELVLVTTGDVVIAFHQGSAVDAISGQEWMFPVAQLQREVEVWQQRGPQARLASADPALEDAWERRA